MKRLIQKILYNSGIKIKKLKNKNFKMCFLGYELSGINPNYYEYPCEANESEIKLMNEILQPHQFKRRYSMTSPERLWAAISAAKYVHNNNIEGDIIECGVWRGGCSLAIAKTLEKLGSNKKIYLFDTFAGMTEPQKYDKKLESGKSAIETYNSSKTDFGSSWCYGSLEDVKKLFFEYGLEDNIIFVKGDVCETLKKSSNLPKSISLLRLDTDWYKSTMSELKVLYPKLSKNGVLLLDDYGSWDGARMAVDEYFSKNLNHNPLFWVNDKGRGLIKNI